jgi:DNA-binding SARP family transcriptional activator
LPTGGIYHLPGAIKEVGDMLEVKLLGQFSLMRDGCPLSLSSEPARLLLAYLLLHAGKPQSRETLAGLFWPESTEANARSNLRHAIWRLRQAIEPDPAPAPGDTILSEGEFIFFNAATPYDLDVDRLANERAEQSLADLLTAVEVYEGELLPGYYEPWVILERERLAACFERRMEALLNRLTLAGQWEAVLVWSERWIAQGVAPESAYRAMMRAHAVRGDSAQVALTYRRCREALAGELGVEPSPLTRRLAEELARSHPLLTSLGQQPGRSDGPADPQIAALDQVEFERRRADLYLYQVKRLNRLVAGLALGLAAAAGVVIARRRR